MSVFAACEWCFSGYPYPNIAAPVGYCSNECFCEHQAAITKRRNMLKRLEQASIRLPYKD